MTLSPGNGYDILQSIKTSFRKMRANRPSSLRASLSKFPADVRMFTSQFPNCFESPPVPSRAAANNLAKSKSVVACRKSNALVRGQQPAPSSQPFGMNAAALAQVAPFLQAILGNRDMHHGHISITHGQPKRSRSDMMLTDGGAAESPPKRDVTIESPSGPSPLQDMPMLGAKIDPVDPRAAKSPPENHHGAGISEWACNPRSSR